MPPGIYQHQKGYRIKPHTKEHKRKIGLANSISHLGKHHSEETKRKISQSEKGKKLSDETKRKIGIAHSGNRCIFWKGGISFSPYAEEWKETLKKSIRQRDGYTCRVCWKEPATQVHHIDYNKQNCNPDNLITLCNSCHSKTNHNRNYWIKYFFENVK